MYTRLIVIFAIFQYLASIYSVVYFKTTRLDCDVNLKYFHNYSCYLKAVNRYKTYGFLTTYIKTSIKNMTVNIALYARNYANIYNPYLVNITFNFCKFMDKKESGLYMNPFMPLLKTFTNINHSCPFTDAFIGKNLYLDKNIIPFPLVLKSSYKLLFMCYEGYPLDFIGSMAFYLQPIDDKQ